MIRILMLLLVCMPFTQPLEAGFWDKITDSYWKKSGNTTPPMVKALIVHDEPGVVVEVKGKYKLFDPRTNEFISSRFIGKRKFIQGLKDGLRWGEEFPGLHQLLIIPDDMSTTTIVDGIEYRGAIYIYDIGGSISIVNEVNIEDYLQSLLARQILEPHSPETLAAVAITARTNAYAQALNPVNPYYAVDARNNGYQGYAVTNSNTAIEKAIDATRFLIMSRSGSNKDDASPFVASWQIGKEDKSKAASTEMAKISLSEADQIAKTGGNAAQILNKAFPNSSIVLMFNEQRKK